MWAWWLVTCRAHMLQWRPLLLHVQLLRGRLRLQCLN